MNYDNPMPPPTVAFITLGCKLNQSETDSIATTLKNHGFSILSEYSTTEHTVPAKYTVINTCTVTAKADRKSRNLIYRALRNAGKYIAPDSSNNAVLFEPTHTSRTHAKANTQNGIVIVTGCFVGSAHNDLKNLPIDYLIDNSKKKYIPDIIESHEQGQIFDVDNVAADYFHYTPSDSVFHTRNNLKIQDGCDNLCTFCIIPMVRGNAHSRPLRDVVQDARMIAEQNTKEIILTGVNMSRYQHEHYTFSDLLESLLKLPNDCRIRISSLEPDNLDDKFFDLLQHPKLCPHLHLCLQSGSDRILLMMRRMYNRKQYMQCVERIRKIDAHYNFTTDIIVGFPGESEQDFNETAHLAREVMFSHIHAFPYSARQGTRASRLPDTSTHIKKQRINTIMKMSDEMKSQYRLSHMNRTHDVLIETVETSNNTLIGKGLSEYYVPFEITGSQHAHSPIQENSIVKVQPTHYTMKREVILQGVAE